MIYTHLSTFYDAIMSHVDYQEWADLIKKITVRFFDNRQISIFEIGGGTGTLGKMLLSKKYNYIGSDISFYMVKSAHKKIAHFLCADGLHIPIKKKFDLAIFLYDGINYLPSLNQYKKLFHSVHSILNSNGYFLFDITTETNSLLYFTDYQYFEEFDDSLILRSSYYLPKKRVQCNDFQIFTPINKKNNIYKKYCENHRQRLFTPKQIESCIPETLFSVAAIWDGFSLLKYHKNSERIHFLLKKM